MFRFFRNFFTLFIILVASYLLFALPVFSATVPAGGGSSDSPVQTNGITQLPTVDLVNPIQSETFDVNKPQDIIGNIIASVVGILGALILLVFIYGGFLWVTSGGKPERIKKGRDTMLWAVIGLFLIFAAYAILSTVIQGLGVTQPPLPNP